MNIAAHSALAGAFRASKAKSLWTSFTQRNALQHRGRFQASTYPISRLPCRFRAQPRSIDEVRLRRAR